MKTEKSKAGSPDCIILGIETGGDNCSVVLSKGCEIIALKEKAGREHSKYLSVFIDDVVRDSGLSYSDIDAVAVGKGPGSYTGLRIGVGTAKGICYGVGKPLIAINSLLSLVSTCRNVLSPASSSLVYCPLIDARRLEVYTALFDMSLHQLSDTEAMIISENSFAEILSTQKVCFFGSGAKKCKEIIKSPNAIFADIENSASGLVYPAVEAFNNSQFEDAAYFEPFYLKDFVVTEKKKSSVNDSKKSVSLRLCNLKKMIN
ncbi:MAG: tRNA (adenosine(37)-N6)-threonylcarbamoyltransferase complex dimerization subunit type 1 TsaB [Prevotellaceae bacterium]|nr:tRNA (adenosine(37)-N6)-threonylcarbamoyltransferase complex dimerization subunit type 1 TsaB [Prevotellaceae bacterium]